MNLQFEVTSIVSSCVRQALETFLEENPQSAKLIMDKVILAAADVTRKARNGSAKNVLLDSPW